MIDTDDNTSYMWINSFEESAVASFYERFFELENSPSVDIITIFIDSYGGEVAGLIAMRDLIKSSLKPVSTVCVGKAMSSGAFLLASGSEGLRFASKNSDIMIHDASGFAMGKVNDMQQTSKWHSKLNKRMFRCLAEDTGNSLSDLEDQISKVKNSDWFLTPKEAKKWGIIDSIEIPRIVYNSPESTLVSISGKKRN